MTPFRAFSWLLPALLVCLLLVGGLKLKQNFTDTLGRIRVDGREYRQSPGCIPNAPDVNPSLPPCRDLPVTVTHKERTSWHSNRLGRECNTNSLEVRDGAGQLHHLTSVMDDLWDSVKLGDQISATTRSDHINHLAYNGSSSSVFDAADHSLSLMEGGTRTWLFVFIAGFCGLALWNILRRLRTPPTLRGGQGW